MVFVYVEICQYESILLSVSKLFLSPLITNQTIISEAMNKFYSGYPDWLIMIIITLVTVSLNLVSQLQSIQKQRLSPVQPTFQIQIYNAYLMLNQYHL